MLQAPLKSKAEMTYQVKDLPNSNLKGDLKLLSCQQDRWIPQELYLLRQLQVHQHLRYLKSHKSQAENQRAVNHHLDPRAVQ